jgi:hypothetical protein
MLSHGFTLPPYPGQAILDELAKLRKDVQERDDRLAAADELIAKLFTGRYYSSLAEIRQDCNVQGHGNLWCLQVPVIQWFHYAGPYSTREAALAAYEAAKEQNDRVQTRRWVWSKATIYATDAKASPHGQMFPIWFRPLHRPRNRRK